MLSFFTKWRKPKPLSISEIAEMHYNQHMEMLGALGFKTLGAKPEMLLVYTDAAGNNYYIARNLWQGISRDRLSAIESATQAVDYRMERPQIMLELQGILTAFQRCKGGDMAAAMEGYKQAWEMYEIMKTAPSDQVLMQYALHILYTDGENPETLDPEFLKIKRHRAEKDDALRAFFLNMALSTANNYIPTSQQDGRDSLEKQKMEEQKKKEASQKRLRGFMSKPAVKKK